MLEILSGLKLGLKTTADDDAIEYKPHLESLHLLLASTNDWLDYIDSFKGWEMYIPTYYVKSIKH